MSSQINDQSVEINTLSLPSGVTLSSTPSLAPNNGVLATDIANAGSLYVGNGSIFNRVMAAPGESSMESTSVTGFSLLSGAGNPNFTGIIMNLQKVIIGTVKRVYFECIVNGTSAAATTPDIWSASAFAIPVGWRPTPGIVFEFPAVTYQGAFTSGTSVFTVLDSGSVQLNVSGVAGPVNTLAYTYTGCYSIP